MTHFGGFVHDPTHFFQNPTPPQAARVSNPSCCQRNVEHCCRLSHEKLPCNCDINLVHNGHLWVPNGVGAPHHACGGRERKGRGGEREEGRERRREKKGKERKRKVAMKWHNFSKNQMCSTKKWSIFAKVLDTPPLLLKQPPMARSVVFANTTKEKPKGDHCT